MKRVRGEHLRWLVVLVFAAAMAWVEAAVVFYLRTMIDRIQPYQPNPFPVIGGFSLAELVREAATLVMLCTVGWLAGRSPRSRVGYTAVAFGAWDIFYYVFLKILCGWPHSLLDWDVLFLIPLPWWGPVLAPVLISLLMVVWGTVASQFDGPVLEASRAWQTWALAIAGMVLSLYVFMADTLRAVSQGLGAVCQVLPVRFNWVLFCVALLLMAAPVAELGGRLWLQRVGRPSTIYAD